MPGKKKFQNFDQVKTGHDAVQFASERGAEIHDSKKGTKIVIPHRGSLLLNESKELSKPDKSHIKRIFKILGIISVLAIGAFMVDAFLASLGVSIPLF